MRRVVHLSSAHYHDDIRIFYKECRTLARAGYEVIFVVPHIERLTIESVQIEGIPAARGRIGRFLVGAMRLYRRARALAAALYHFHDPDLIFVGMLLKRGGARVIYDAHEDLPKQISTKDWIPPLLRGGVMRAADYWEKRAAREFDAIIAATPAIAQRFPREKTTVVQNFPLREDLYLQASGALHQRPLRVCYLGGLSQIRGARVMVEAMARLQTPDASLWIAGALIPASLEQTLACHPGWKRVHLLGWQPRDQAAELMMQARAGLVVFQPAPNHYEAQPTKLFEYMSAGLPVIGSDFPLWRSIIAEHCCGLLVDPTNPEAVADAIDWVLNHPAEAAAMGNRGRTMVEERYNWESEAQNLLHAYQRILP